MYRNGHKGIRQEQHLQNLNTKPRKVHLTSHNTFIGQTVLEFFQGAFLVVVSGVKFQVGR